MTSRFTHRLDKGTLRLCPSSALPCFPKPPGPGYLSTGPVHSYEDRTGDLGSRRVPHRSWFGEEKRLGVEPFPLVEREGVGGGTPDTSTLT